MRAALLYIVGSLLVIAIGGFLAFTQAAAWWRIAFGDGCAL